MRAALSAFAGRALAALCCLIPTVAAAEGVTDRVALLGQAGAEDDADELGNMAMRRGALFGYRSHLHHWGLALQNAHYSQGGWSEDVTGVVGLYRNQRADDASWQTTGIAELRAEGPAAGRQGAHRGQPGVQSCRWLRCQRRLLVRLGQRQRDRPTDSLSVAPGKIQSPLPASPPQAPEGFGAVLRHWARYGTSVRP